MKLVEIEFQGPHEILFSAPGYFGYVQKGDKIKVEKNCFENSLKNKKILGSDQPRWKLVKPEPKQENTEPEPNKTE